MAGKTIYPDKKLLAKLESLAKAQGRSFNNLVLRLLAGVVK